MFKSLAVSVFDADGFDELAIEVLVDLASDGLFLVGCLLAPAGVRGNKQQVTVLEGADREVVGERRVEYAGPLLLESDRFYFLTNPGLVDELVESVPDGFQWLLPRL